MSDGRFSSKPIRSGRRADVTADAFSAEAMTSPDAAQAFVQSAAVQREVNALMRQPFPEVGEMECAPFPGRTPNGAMDLGRPLASAVLVQEYLIGLIFLRVCGWLFLGCGGLLVLTAIITALSPLGRGNQAGGFAMVPVLGMIGLGIAGAGAWFGIFRGRVVNQMCWFCPRGMVWMTEKDFEWYAWQEIPEVYCDLHAHRPAVGIRFDGDIAWISFSNTQVSRSMLDYIENRASAAWMSATLQLFAEGRRIQFGSWRLHRSAVHVLADGVEWKNVIDVQKHGRELVIHHGERGEIAVSLDEIPYPSLMVTLARAMHAYAHEV